MKIFTVIQIIFFHCIIQTKADLCGENQCYSVFINMCIKLTPDIVGIDSDSQKCLFDRDIAKKVNKCFDIEKNGKSSVCKNKQNTMCITITEDIQDQYIGIYKDAQMNLICIEKQDIIDQLKIKSPLILVNLKFEYCLKDDFSLDEFYQRPNSMICSCKYQYCLSNGICIPMDSNQNAARDINQNCAQLNQEGKIQSCFSDKSICLLKNSITQINKCTTYQSIDLVIGVAFINQTNECILKDQYANLVINKNLVFLKSPYCLFESSHILQVGDLNNKIVGRTQQYLCAQEIEVFSDGDNLIEMCIFGFCISKYSCVEMDDFEYISKKHDNSCSTNSETDFIECFYSPELKSTCILEDNGLRSCELMTIENPKTFGAIYQENNQIGICISQDVPIPLQSLVSQNKKLTCSDGSCILQSVNMLKDYVQCTKMTQTGITTTQDDNGFCKETFPSKKCRMDQQCLMNGICVDMSQDTSLPNFAKELITTSCLPYQDIQQNGQKIKSCPTGFCIIQVQSNQRYCFQLGAYLGDIQYLGLESLTQKCLAQFEISQIGIDECGDPNYCIFQIPIKSIQKSYLCHSLQLESAQYPGNRVPAKNNLGKCQDLFLPSTISCVDGFQCINDKGECQPLSVNQPIARDVNQQCQPAYTDQSLYCAEGYCLLNQVCLPLSIQNPGRENKTSKCLQEGEKGAFGAIQCFQSFCLTGISDEPQDQFCALIDYKISSQVGRYIQSQKCVKEDDNNNVVNKFKIEYCYKGQYCMRKDSQGIQFCSKVLSNDIICSDVNGACIFSKDPIQKCSSCSYTQCLDKYTQKCINLGVVYCQDNNGFCSNFQSSNNPYCVVCPKYYCLNKKTQICTYYQEMYSLLQYSQTNCLYQFKQDEECIIQDINSANKYQENLCIDKNYFCLPIVEAQKTKNCLFCPKYYYNPGVGICYQKSNNKNYPYFNLDIQYVSEDCYPKNDCSISNQKCPEGCQKCDNLNMCTQCMEDYFLYQDNQTQNQFCIKCDTNIYSNISQDPILSQQGTQFYKCIQCNIQDEDWNLNTWQNKNCAKMVVQIAGIKRFTNTYSKILYYSIQRGNSQNLDSNQANRKLVNLIIHKEQTSLACSNLCIRCESNPSKKPYCYRCIDYYYSDLNGICQKCPLNCQKCGRTILEQNLQPILKDDIPKEDLDKGIYNFSKSIFACIQCNTQYTVSPNFNQCDQCGLYCLECAYEFSGDLINYRKQNFRNQVYQFLKCLKCKPGYTLSSNRKDCKQIYQLNYCLNQDLTDYYTGLSLITFLDLSSKSFRYNCLTCNYNSCLYYKRCYNQGYSPRNYVYNCGYSLDQGFFYLTTLNSCLNGYPTVYQGSLSCDFNTQCKKQIYQCIECFVSNNTYQCKICSQGYIPSIFGCIPCPETCQTCYEEGYVNYKRVNFTNYIINTPQTTIKFSLQQRMNYKNDFMIKMKCSDCKFGYYLNYTQQYCQKPQCGQYCQNCINFYESPLCTSCNYTKLFNLIAPIQGYISKIHYGTNFLSNFQQMITFNSLQTNCQICPLLCETCEDNNLDLVLDPLSLYKVKCYSCKQQLPNNYGDMQKYEIRYDKARMRCIYCLKNDNGCFFKKKTEIFAECGTASQPLGKGTFDEPLNLYKINETNLDQLIINEPEFDIGIIYYNELQLREIDFIINFIDKSRLCNLDFALSISTNIKNKIPSIQTLSITLNANQTNSLTDYEMLQNDIATFKGFSSFKIQNMNVKPKNLNSNFGFKIYEENINNIEFQNTTFLCQRQYTNQLQTYFDNFNGTFIMNNTLFNNCSFYQQTLINVHSDFYPTFITYQLTNLSILYSDFSQKSSFISVNSPSDLEIQDFKFMHGSLSYQSNVFASYYQGQEVTSISNVTNILFQNSTFLSYSQILQGERFMYFSLLNFTFANSNCQQNQQLKMKMYLFQVNTIKAQNIILQSNYFEKAQFIQFSPILDSEDQIMISIDQILVFNNTFNSFEQLLFSYSGKFKTEVIISNFNISQNKYSQNYGIYYFQIRQANSIFLSNGNVNEPQLITIIQAFGVNQVSIQIIQFGDKISQSTSLSLINIQDLIQQIEMKTVTFNLIIADEILLIVNQQINNQFDPNQFQAIFNSVTFNQVILRKQARIKQNIQIFSAAQITIMQGYTNMNFIQAYNTIQPPINLQTDTFFSSIINVKNVIGKLEIINTKIMNIQNHPNHNLLYIQGSQVQIEYSSFTILADNQQKLQFLSGGTSTSSSILGGIAMIQCSDLKILSSSFSGGLSLQGGGLYIQAISLANIYIYQTNFTENWSFSLSDLKNSNGGAVYINQQQQNLGVTLRFIQCLFSNNFAYSQGGAMYVSSNKNKFYLNLLLSNFLNNFSKDGSSLYSSQQNLTNIVQIQQTQNIYSYKYISDFIQIIQQFIEPISSSPSLYHLQGFDQVYLLQNTFTVEAKSIELNTKENENLYIFQSLIIFNQVNYLQLAQNKISNFKVQNYLLKMTNIEEISLSQDQFFDNQQFIYNPNQFLANSLIVIQANSIKLEQIIYINNTCSKCAQGNLQVISNHILIADSIFQQNIALNGGALSISQYVKDEIMTNKLRFLHFYSYYEEYLIRRSNQNQTIYNSTFLKNTALNNGGSIIASNTFLYIIKSNFQENNANQFGGAIVSDLNDKFDQFQKIHLIKNTIQSNKARIGSSFYQIQNLPLQYQLDNKLSNNEAQLYNDNLIQFAVQFLGIKGQQTYRNSLSIDKHMNGKFKDDIVLQLVNNEDQPITTLSEEIKLNVQVLKGEDYYIDQYYISQKSGVFELKDKINVFGRLGKQIILQISSEYAKSPIYKYDGELTKMETNISFEIEINMIKKCPVGTTYFNDTLKKDLCNPCPQFMYNLNDGDKCQKCPNDFLCEKTSIYLPMGFWRSKNNSYNYIECFGYFQCVGDIHRIRITEQYSDENRYCQEGNIGALCMDCDLYGNYWNERYYHVAPFTCLKCGQFNTNLIIDIMVLLLSLALFAKIANSIFKLMDYLKIQKVFQVLKIYFKYDQRFFVISNILLNYFTQLSLCAKNMIYLPTYLKQIFLGFGNPSEIILKLFDCVLSYNIQFQDNQYIYLYIRIIILLIFNLLISLCILLCFIIQKNKDLLAHISVLIYFTINLLTHTIDSTLRMIFCIQVDGQLYASQYPNIKCDENHLSFVKKLLIPCLCIQLLFIFLVFLYIFRENQSFANSRKISNIFNQFYKYYWWYFYQILIRLLIIAMDNYFIFDVQLKGSILCSLYLSYTLTQLYFYPYNRLQFNYFEIFISILITVNFGIIENLNQFSYQERIFIVFLALNITCVSGFIYWAIRDEVKLIIQKIVSITKQNSINSQKKKSPILLWKLIRLRISNKQIFINNNINNNEILFYRNISSYIPKQNTLITHYQKNQLTISKSKY
ncbi:transmembrane protein, putative (macronuclear) [Tetrahymena thermophila SB210]|uniref:Transmembrane protein, putative n=1 Tax=Tetrahymena thermophila (strain SB210) TaxID=312017 RepID=W7XC03_TETTS|nr:transmembrane protein, putative [Tetrahymena thermophila SB210]EWS73983.1 transmembrane protein, putative [Tetrahymena thermophila SB210]|eukprot:XP_012653486.1 transmembrane protein, putative [Tetrahymena thermophila SB210]